MSAEACGRALPPVRDSKQTPLQDTDVSRPPAALQRHMPGASPTGKDTERLVHNVAPRAHTTPAPDANCPTCGLDGEGVTHPGDVHGVLVANYLCPAGHIWTTSWLEGA